jgi:MFS family permease
MTIPFPNPAHKLLDMLDEDEIEQLPLDVVKEQLREYDADATVPDRLPKLVGDKERPAEYLLSLLEFEDVGEQALPEVVAALEREGIDHAAGIKQLDLGSHDGAILVKVEGNPRVYGVGETIPLKTHPARAAVTVTDEDRVLLASFTLPEADEDELEHPGPPRVRLSVKGGTAVVQQEVPATDLALFDASRWLGCHWIVALLLAAGWMIVGAQVMLIETVHGAFASPTYLYAVATYLLGTIPGAVLFGPLADRVGRKPVYTATAFIYMATGFATALLPPDLYGFAALRFLVGAAAGADYVVLNTTLQELMPKRSRGWACLAVNSAFWLGLAAVELIPLLPGGTGTGAIMDQWQTLFWTVGVLGAVLLGLRWFLPESPRWLIAHCRKDRQTDSMLKEIRRDLASRDELPATAGPRLMVPVRVPGLSLAGLLWRKYRRQTLVCLALICSQAFFYNAFSFPFSAMLEALYGGLEGPIASKHLVYYIAAANFAGPLLLGWLFDKAGRKTMIWASYMISGCLMLWVSALLLLDYLPRGSVEMTVVWAVIFFFASTAASSAYLTLGESFPAEIRATAFSLLFGVAMLVGVLGSLLHGWLTGDLQQAPGAHALAVQQHEQVILGVLGLLAGAAMAAAAAVEKAIGTEYAQLSLEENAPSLPENNGSSAPVGASGNVVSPRPVG